MNNHEKCNNAAMMMTPFCRSPTIYIFLLLPIAADFVVGVTAVDQDSGNNGKVHYTLEGPDKTFFHIGSATGVITHAGRVQKQRTTFTFTVRASDLVLFSFTLQYQQL